MAADTLRRTKDLGKSASVRDALTATNLNTVVGSVKWGGKGPFKNVSKTPLVGGQWRRGGKYKYDLVVVTNKAAPNIPLQGKMEIIS